MYINFCLFLYNFTDVDECSSNPCFHGSCDDGINEYACDCQNGFIGTHCEISKLQNMIKICYIRTSQTKEL